MSKDSAGSVGDYGRPGQPLTYSEVGATGSKHLPGGYRHLHVVRQIGFGQEWFDTVAQRLTSWDMHRRADLQVDADSVATPGQTVVLRFGLGLLKINAPVRVVYLVNDVRERGFAYGTLPSHPEIGEERFTVRIDDDNVVYAEICAFSRPGRWFTRAAGPLARRVQDAITQRYLNALRSSQLLPCPCCGHRTLATRGEYELCPVCYWEDDPNQSRHPSSADGANGHSLIESRQTYQRIGAIAPDFVDRVRPPRPQELSSDG